MYRWSTLNIPRFYGLDQKSNIVDVKDGETIDCENVFQSKFGVISKRRGNSVMFDADASSGSLRIDEIGSATISGTKYYFKFSDGDFFYSTTITGSLTAISPAPSIAVGELIFWVVLDDRIFFVDGTNNLRFFDGTQIVDSVVYTRPTVAPTGAGGVGFDYGYTVEKGVDAAGNGTGESPLVTTSLINIGSAATITVTGNTGPQTLVVTDKIRIYSKATTVAASNKNVTPTSGAHANGVYGEDEFGGYLRITSVAASYAIITVAITDSLPNLYSDLGIALNKSAPTALEGITEHYGRLVGWKGDYVYNSKISNANSWPDDSAAKEAFVYGFALGDGDQITRCISYRESLFVMKPTKIAVFVGIGPDDTGNNAYALRRLETNGIGCIAPKSAQITGEEKESILIFLSRDGFYASTGDAPIRIGEKIEDNILGISDSILSISASFYHKRDGFYYCFVGADSNKTGWIIDTRKDNDTMVGWFKLSDVDAVCVHWDNDKYIFGRSDGICLSEKNSLTSADFSDVLAEYVAAASVNTGTDQITVSNDYATGTELKLRSVGGLPAPLVANTSYYAIRVSATVIKLATSLANANLGTAIDLTTAGTGNHTIISAFAISAFYTTNWIKFKDPALVKKLAKPAIILNAQSVSISLVMYSAYDWVPQFSDAQTIDIESSHLWGSGLWGSFIWGGGVVAAPKNVAIARRKCRSVRYKFENNTLNQDFDLQGIQQDFAYIRNRNNFA